MAYKTICDLEQEGTMLGFPAPVRLSDGVITYRSFAMREEAESAQTKFEDDIARFMANRPVAKHHRQI